MSVNVLEPSSDSSQVRHLNDAEIDEVSGGLLGAIVWLVVGFEVGFLAGYMAGNYMDTGNPFKEKTINVPMHMH